MIAAANPLARRPTPAAAMAAIAVALLAYAAARAVTVPLTADEARTFNLYVEISWYDFFAHRYLVHANNHLLNTIAMRLLSAAFGTAEAVLRIGSLACFALYLYAAARIAGHFAGARSAVGAFVLLAVNPYLIEFFALARGYAWGLAFLLLAVAIVDAPLTRGARVDRHAARRALFAGFAACFGTFAFLPVYATLLGYLFVERLGLPGLAGLVRRGGLAAAWREARDLFVWAIVNVLVFLPILFMLHLPGRGRGGTGILDYAAGVADRTFGELAAKTLVLPASWQWAPAAAAVFAVAATVLALVALRPAPAAAGTDDPQRRRLGFFTFMFAVTAALLMLQAVAVTQVLPNARKALYLMPLFMLMLAALALAPRGGARRWRALMPVGLAVAAALAVRTVATANLSTTAEWPEYRHVRPVVQALDCAMARTPGPATLTLGINVNLPYAARYYRDRHGLDDLAIGPLRLGMEETEMVGRIANSDVVYLSHLPDRWTYHHLLAGHELLFADAGDDVAVHVRAHPADRAAALRACYAAASR